MNETMKTSRRSSPLAFDWGDDAFGDKNKIDLLDPFLESNDGSFVSEEQLEYSTETTPRPLAMLDTVTPKTEETQSTSGGESKKRSLQASTGTGESSGGFSRRKKKPKGMPKRPLSAYNLYFQSARAKILATAEGEGQKIGFEGLGKIIGKKWRDISAADRKVYETLAEKDGERYRKEMEAFNELKAKRKEAEERESESRFNASLPRTTTPQPSAFESTSSYIMRSPNTNQSSDGFVVAPMGGATVEVTSREEFSRLHNMTAPAPMPYGGAPASFGNPPSAENISPCPPYPPSYESSMHHAGGSRHPMMGMAQGVEPVAPPDGFQMPPGMEIVLSDRAGKDRKYRVQYNCYSMPRDAAQKFIQNLTGASSNDPRNPSFHQHPVNNNMSGGQPPQGILCEVDVSANLMLVAGPSLYISIKTHGVCILLERSQFVHAQLFSPTPITHTS
eukprot:Nitzschia sp. Nitz4//scaffold112_size70979//28361//29865//NITZ4_005901-RA/size70979-snap-gene-0.131-mRNA-1//1//CDS//3329533262//8178//frame0